MMCDLYAFVIPTIQLILGNEKQAFLFEPNEQLIYPTVISEKLAKPTKAIYALFFEKSHSTDNFMNQTLNNDTYIMGQLLVRKYNLELWYEYIGDNIQVHMNIDTSFYSTRSIIDVIIA